MDPQVRRSAASVQLLLQLGAEHGLDTGPCLHGTHLDAAHLFEADSAVTAEQELQVIRNLLRAFGSDCGLGLEAGLRLRLSTHGILGYAMLSCATLREALAMLLRYPDLTFAYCDLVVEEDAQELRMVVEDAQAPAELRQFLVERITGGAYALTREMLGRGLSVRRLQFRFPRPAYAERFTTLGGVAPQFGADNNLIAVDAALLDLPLPQANALTLRLCEEQCRQLLHRRRARSGLAAAVRDRLLHRPDRMPDIETVAAALNLTSRTLRRRLDAEGTSFRGLADEVRATLAEGWLGSNLKVEDVATRLGFSEASSFIRAFKRWTGRTPGSVTPAARNAPPG